MVKGRTSMGPQRIEMKRIARYSSRHVTFSKRRSGLFMKASKLCTLTGAEVVVVVFSPSNNTYSFGHPSVDSIVHRFLSKNCARIVEESVFSIVNGCQRPNVKELTWEYSELLIQLKKEKKRSEELKRVGDSHDSITPWWEAPIQNLNLPELQCLADMLVKLKKRLIERATQMAAQVPDPSSLLSGSSIGAADLPSTSQTTMNDALIGAPVSGFGFENGFGPEPF